MLLEKVDRSEEPGREDCTDAEHVGAVHEAAEHLRVDAQDRLVGDGVHGVGIMWALQEMAAPGKNGANFILISLINSNILMD